MPNSNEKRDKDRKGEFSPEICRETLDYSACGQTISAELRLHDVN
jgi:hypothetical protein